MLEAYRNGLLCCDRENFNVTDNLLHINFVDAWDC